MSRGTVPIVTCDDEYGCDQWMLDEYTMGISNWADHLDGWKYDPYRYDDDALCPRCVVAVAERADDALALRASKPSAPAQGGAE